MTRRRLALVPAVFSSIVCGGDSLALHERVDTLVIAIRTGDGPNDGTNGMPVSLCLSEDACFPLELPRVNDFRAGGLDVYYFEDLAMRRKDLDRVELKVAGGSDAWAPACLQFQLDGEPVYCQDELDVVLGDDINELQRWSDPDALSASCTTCFPSPLTHGPMVGAIGPDTAKLWFRTDATRRVEVRVGLTNDPMVPLWVESAFPSATDDYATTVDVDRLEPSTQYYYEVATDGVVRATGDFQTAPPEDSAGGLRFAFGSCAYYAEQPIFATIEAEDPDLFFFLGDSHYGNSVDVGGLRWFYRRGFESTHRASLLRTTPTMAIWDDHDFTGNNSNGYAEGKDVALRVFKEYWANPSYGTEDADGVFFNYRWGDVEFFMLDTRWYRKIDGDMLGAKQRRWLEEQLLASTATFKFIASGSQFTNSGTWESWKEFPAARDDLFGFIAQQSIEGVVLMSGDLHASELRRINQTDLGSYALPEITSSRLAADAYKCDVGDPEHIACFADDFSFVALDVDTAASDPTVTARIIDIHGENRGEWTISRSELQR